MSASIECSEGFARVMPFNGPDAAKRNRVTSPLPEVQSGMNSSEITPPRAAKSHTHTNNINTDRKRFLKDTFTLGMCESYNCNLLSTNVSKAITYFDQSKCVIEVVDCMNDKLHRRGYLLDRSLRISSALTIINPLHKVRIVYTLYHINPAHINCFLFLTLYPPPLQTLWLKDR